MKTEMVEQNRLRENECFEKKDYQLTQNTSNNLDCRLYYSLESPREKGDGWKVGNAFEQRLHNQRL